MAEERRLYKNTTHKRVMVAGTQVVLSRDASGVVSPWVYPANRWVLPGEIVALTEAQATPGLFVPAEEEGQ